MKRNYEHVRCGTEIPIPINHACLCSFTSLSFLWERGCRNRSPIFIVLLISGHRSRKDSYNVYFEPLKWSCRVHEPRNPTSTCMSLHRIYNFTVDEACRNSYRYKCHPKCFKRFIPNVLGWRSNIDHKVRLCISFHQDLIYSSWKHDRFEPRLWFLSKKPRICGRSIWLTAFNDYQ